MNRFFVALVLLTLVAGCAVMPDGKVRDPAVLEARLATKVALFSASPAGDLPSGWEPLIILSNKKQTEYQLVAVQGKTVLHAHAVESSSGLMHQLSIDPLKQSWLRWQWKISSLIKAADNFQRETEDSPVRIILGFDGDKDTLPFADQMLFETARILTGHDFPYATLMYIWENKAPVGTVIPNSRSDRIKMVVAASGPDGVDQWREFTRNIVDDYERAFGEKPGKLIGVGLMTDTDNTGETVDAWYGDISLQRHGK